MVKTRFAPSPTGYLHVGNARTAIFNRLYAEAGCGSFVLRIEDTDTERSGRIYEDAILEDLRWLGIDWDEGPDRGGPSGPYRQSERLDIYRDYANRLLSSKSAYPCYCSKERLAELKRKQASQGMPPRYDGLCRGLKEGERPGDVSPVLRFRVPRRKVVVSDKVYGEVTFDTSAFGDFVIIGSDGIATYNFAVVIDDGLMGVTHIIRGEDHLPNTPRQLLIYEALGFEMPLYAHMPMILGGDRRPLSKRHGISSIKGLREAGFLPEALFNYLCHLGWSPGRDLLTREEALSSFSLDGLSRSPSVFDISRLKRFNRHYIGIADNERLLELLRPRFQGVDEDWLRGAIDALKGEAETLADFPSLLEVFLEEVGYDTLDCLKEPYVSELLEKLLVEVRGYHELNSAVYKEVIKNLMSSTGEKGKRLFMPLRAALTGRTHGIELEKVFCLLGREKVIKRVERALCL